MILFYDTETTGLPDFKARSDEPTQPHLVQLALVLHDDACVEIRGGSWIIKPDGWIIPPELTAIHGISQERAMDEGIPEWEAMEHFIQAANRTTLRVAHNENFDRRIMRIAMLRYGIERDVVEFMEARPSFDTCRAALPIVNLPPTAKMMEKRMMSPKPPKLEECMKHFFDEDLPGAHDALVDTRACARVYWHLQSLEAKP